jgi:hypothetical protein
MNFFHGLPAVAFCCLQLQDALTHLGQFTLKLSFGFSFAIYLGGMHNGTMKYGSIITALWQ